MVYYDFSYVNTSKEELSILLKLRTTEMLYSEIYDSFIKYGFAQRVVDKMPDGEGGYTPVGTAKVKITEKGARYLDVLHERKIERTKSFIFDIVNLIFGLSGVVLGIIGLLK